MLKNSKNKGITLIALVITIIVLLILAGISISMLTGNNGILQRTINSKENTEESQIKEKINLAYSSALANGKGNISEDLFVEELTKEFGTRNVEYTLINSKDGKSWTISINGTNVKENITKPTNLQTEPINPEVEYGYSGKSGVVDANTLKEGDIINYYYDVTKEPISCAVLYNDNTHGLQVVSLDSVRDVTLGYDKTSTDPETDRVFENGTPSGYDNTEQEKARWSYNHAFQTLKKYAMEYIGSMAINVRCTGAPDNTIKDEDKINNMYKDENHPYFESFNNLFKNSDNWHLDETLSKMDSLNILKTNNPSNYWIASRVIYFSDWGAPKHGTNFALNYVNSNGQINNQYVITIASLDGETSRLGALLARTNGLRPIFILRDDIKIEKTGHLN